MGLDMYLYGRLYVGGGFEHREYNGKLKFSIRGKDFTIPISKVSEITLDVGYWRKVNAIHNWFVQNCQDGIDECQQTFISIEKLEELKAVCQKVLEDTSNADSLLPPQSGFFFGGTDIDEYYIQSIKDTIGIVDAAIKAIEVYEVDIYYQSSW